MIKKLLKAIFFLFCFKLYALEPCEVLIDELKQQGIKSQKVLDAIKEVPRSKFVPKAYKRLACANRPLPIGNEQTISQPYIVAYMTEALSLSPEDKVLEIGTGSGYQAAVLSGLVKSVYSIEIIKALADKSQGLLKELGYNNVHVRHGNGFYGWPEQAPFDAIIVTAAPEKVPKVLLEQLADGGRLIVPVGEEDTTQKLLIYSKSAGKLSKKELIPVIFVPMTGAGA